MIDNKTVVVECPLCGKKHCVPANIRFFGDIRICKECRDKDTIVYRRDYK